MSTIFARKPVPLCLKAEYLQIGEISRHLHISRSGIYQENATIVVDALGPIRVVGDNARVDNLAPEAQRDYGATDAMLVGQPDIEDVLPVLDGWVKDCAETAQKVAVYAGEKLWDLTVPILQVESERAGLPKFEVEKGIDLGRLSNSLFKRAHRPPELPNNFWLPNDFHEVISHCGRLGIPVGDPQSIKDQVQASAQVLDRFVEGVSTYTNTFAI